MNSLLARVEDDELSGELYYLTMARTLLLGLDRDKVADAG